MDDVDIGTDLGRLEHCIQEKRVYRYDKDPLDMRFSKFGRPILSPIPGRDLAVYNPDSGFKLDNFGGMLFTRKDLDGVGHLELAWSSDGIHFYRTFKNFLCAYEDPDGGHGLEDPRITPLTYKYNDIKWTEYHIFHTAFKGEEKDENGNGINTTRIKRATTENWKKVQKHPEKLVDGLGNNKNAKLFPEQIDSFYAMLHRPFDENNPDIHLSFSPDMNYWFGNYHLLAPRAGKWDSNRIGANYLFKTIYGWLLGYHGVDNNNIYRMGHAYLDLEDPRKVLWRSKKPDLEPEYKFERQGIVQNVVFGQGFNNDLSKFYYGCADTCISFAEVEINDRNAILETKPIVIN